jgi:hypothetical protein
MRLGLTISLFPFVAAALACSDSTTDPLPPDDILPLTELTDTYLGLPGGLYPDMRNDPPPDHAAAGSVALSRIEPLDGQGHSDPNGKIVLASVGMSNTTQEFCSPKEDVPCASWSFMGQAAVDADVDRAHLEIVNGALGGQTTVTWDEADDSNYDRVLRSWLEPRELTESQIQVAWVKLAHPRPTVSLPVENADAYLLEAGLGRVVRAMKARWPNLQIVFFSSRTYGGYATTTLNPEPYAYESGFSVRGVIEAQVQQSRTGQIDVEAGDVGLAGGAPWLAWGPYLWADGTNPRADGLIWVRSDFDEDGTHPSESGEGKVGTLLLDFFKSSPYAQCWFLAGRSCPS